jgi:hypothetical protein
VCVQWAGRGLERTIMSSWAVSTVVAAMVVSGTPLH